MKDFRFVLVFVLIFLTLSLSSCEAIGDIFKAGAWTAVIGIFLVVLLIWFLVRKMRG